MSTRLSLKQVACWMSHPPFGMKKSAEIMTALSKDSWNQSISLFISFLLDKNIIYKEKSYVYNKDNNDAIINVC